MRSRYAAYVVGDQHYLLRTWHPRTRPAELDLDGRTEWLGLRIEWVEPIDPGALVGVVEFRARYRRDGAPGEVAERSTFARRAGRWCYRSGERMD